MKHGLILLAMIFALTACFDAMPSLPGNTTPTPANRLTYDAPVSLTIKTGTTLPGTNLTYIGKSETGAAKLTLGGVLAPKQVADAVDWQGMPVSNVNVRLNLRVAAFDEQTITLVGTARVEITDIKVQPGGSPGAALLEFSSPVTFSLAKNELMPGSMLVYKGATADGAEFLGMEGYPFRKQFDSLQYVGRVNPKVFLKFDLRVLKFDANGATLGGTVGIRIEQ